MLPKQNGSQKRSNGTQTNMNLGHFDVLGPAFIKYDSKIIKIHKYTENNSTFTYELKDGLLYLDEITPEGKKRMKANDYMRGLQ